MTLTPAETRYILTLMGQMPDRTLIRPDPEFTGSDVLALAEKLRAAMK